MPTTIYYIPAGQLNPTEPIKLIDVDLISGNRFVGVGDTTIKTFYTDGQENWPDKYFARRSDAVNFLRGEVTKQKEWLKEWIVAEQNRTKALEEYLGKQ